MNDLNDIEYLEFRSFTKEEREENERLARIGSVATTCSRAREAGSGQGGVEERSQQDGGVPAPVAEGLRMAVRIWKAKAAELTDHADLSEWTEFEFVRDDWYRLAADCERKINVMQTWLAARSAASEASGRGNANHTNPKG